MNNDAVDNGGEEGEDGIEDPKDGHGVRERGGQVHYVAGVGSHAAKE